MLCGTAWTDAGALDVIAPMIGGRSVPVPDGPWLVIAPGEGLETTPAIDAEGWVCAFLLEFALALQPGRGGERRGPRPA